MTWLNADTRATHGSQLKQIARQMNNARGRRRWKNFRLPHKPTLARRTKGGQFVPDTTHFLVVLVVGEDVCVILYYITPKKNAFGLTNVLDISTTLAPLFLPCLFQWLVTYSVLHREAIEENKIWNKGGTKLEYQIECSMKVCPKFPHLFWGQFGVSGHIPSLHKVWISVRISAI